MKFRSLTTFFWLGLVVILMAACGEQPTLTPSDQATAPNPSTLVPTSVTVPTSASTGNTPQAKMGNCPTEASPAVCKVIDSQNNVTSYQRESTINTTTTETTIFVAPNSFSLVASANGTKKYTTYANNSLFTSSDGTTWTKQTTPGSIDTMLNQLKMQSILAKATITDLPDDQLDGKPVGAFKYTVSGAGGERIGTVWYDKTTYLILKTSTKVSANGQQITSDAIFSKYNSSDNKVEVPTNVKS